MPKSPSKPPTATAPCRNCKRGVVELFKKSPGLMLGSCNICRRTYARV